MNTPDQSSLTQRINQVRAKELEIDIINQSLFHLDKVGLVETFKENPTDVVKNISAGNCPNLIHQLLNDREKANFYRNIQ